MHCTKSPHPEMSATLSRIPLVRTLGCALAVAVILVTPALHLSANASEAAEEVRFAPNAQSFRLENGMDVVVIPDRRAPVVTHMVWYRVGAADEPPGVSGIAHFLEHLMFKGTPNFPDGEFSKIVAERGGQENAFTGQDYTGYFQRTAKEHLEQLMIMESDRMRNLVLDEASVTTEREVILEERRSRIDNNPGSQLSEAVSAAFYQAHPYGIPIIGWEHEMRILDREDALAFYDQFYGPENAILVVAGDVEPETVLTLANETYGKVEPLGDPIVRQRPQDPPALARREVTLRDDRVRQPSVQAHFPVPSGMTADQGVSEAFDVLAEVIGSGPTSRLYRALVIEKQIATNVGAWYQGSSMDATRFGFYGTPRGDISLRDLEAEIMAILDDVIVNGVTSQEVERAKSSMLASAVYAQDSQQTLARIFGAALSVGESVESVQTWPSRMAAVTPEDVQAVAKRYLNTDAITVGYLLPPDTSVDGDDEEGDRS